MSISLMLPFKMVVHELPASVDFSTPELQHKYRMLELLGSIIISVVWLAFIFPIDVHEAPPSVDFKIPML